MKSPVHPPETVADYIASFPRDVQAILSKIRAAIRKAAPQAEETVSYRMPAYKLNGPLIYFAAFKSHIGLYPMLANVKTRFKKELAGYEGGKGTVRLPLDRPIPYGLIARITKFRVQENAAKAQAKRTNSKRRRSG